jgi:hypothetical protein
MAEAGSFESARRCLRRLTATRHLCDGWMTPGALHPQIMQRPTFGRAGDQLDVQKA